MNLSNILEAIFDDKSKEKLHKLLVCERYIKLPKLQSI